MNAILLVGGLGTRLRPLTLHRPKALLPVLNKPFLNYQLDILKEAGVKHVMLAAGPEAEHWERALRHVKPKGLHLHFWYEKVRLGTGGAIRFAFDELRQRRLASPDPVLVLNGDILLELDVKRFLAFHRNRKACGSLALTRVADPSRYGLIKTNPRGRVVRFLEKPQHFHGPAMINAGAYLLDPTLIQRIFPGRTVSIERECFPLFLKTGEPMYGFPLRGYWNDIGTHATYLSAHRDLLRRRNRWTPPRFFRKRGAPKRGRVLIESSSSVKRSRLEGTVCIGPNVRVERGCRIRDSVILEDVRIGSGTQIINAIVGPRCRIGKNCFLSEGTVLGDGTTLSEFTRS